MCDGFVPRCQLASSTLLSLGTHGDLVAGSGITAGRIYRHQIPMMGPLRRGLCGNFPALPAFKVGICHRKKFRGHFAGPFLRMPSACAENLSKQRCDRRHRQATRPATERPVGEEPPVKPLLSPCTPCSDSRPVIATEAIMRTKAKCYRMRATATMAVSSRGLSTTGSEARHVEQQ